MEKEQSEEEEQIKTKNVQVLDWLSKGLAALDAAEGGNSLHPWAESLVQHDAGSFSSMTTKMFREAAVYCFAEANSLLDPCNPWLCFQTAWTILTYEEEPLQLTLARLALNAALEVEPDCRPAHLAMAWLLYREQSLGTNQDMEPPESLWLRPIGEHLRKALEGADWENRGNVTMRVAAWIARPAEVLLESQGFMRPPYFITRTTQFAAVRALDALADLVPETHRFWHAYVMADLVEGDALRLRWEEEALRWPVQDEVALSGVNTSLTNLQQRAGHLLASLRSFCAAGEHLLKVAQSDDRGLLDRWGLSVEWLDRCPYEGGEVPNGAQELYLQVVDVALAVWQADESPSVFQHCFQQMGVLTAWAGRQLLDVHDRKRAEKYLAAATEFEKGAMDCAENFGDCFEEDQLPPVRGPQDWRVITARSWRDIHIEKGQWQQADASNDQILELLPGDHDARDKKLSLAQLVSSMAIEERQSLDRMDAAMGQLLSSMRPQAPASVSLPPDMAARLEESRKSLDQLIETSTQQQEMLEDLSNRVHDQMQKEAQLSPTALRNADQMLIAELGNETFEALLPDSRVILETAECFYYASEKVADQTDAAPIAVEYAKVVEMELRTRFLPKMADELRKQNYRNQLRVHPRRVIYVHQLGDLCLGDIAALLNSLAAGDADMKVLRLMKRIEPSTDALRKLADETKRVADYRNDAAHVGKVNRDAAAKLRSLLIKEGFLKRLAAFVARCEDL
jgi:hypothetical protein